MRRRLIAFLIVLPLFVAGALPCRASGASASADNVVLIVVDAMRPDRLSAYGNPRKTSPALDALAREGALFLNAEATSNWTLPALASIMTSMDPSAHGAVHPPSGRPGWAKELEKGLFKAHPAGRLDSSRPTLAGVLSRAGWTTAGIVSGGICQSAFGFASGFQSYRDTALKLEALNDRHILPWLRARRRKKFFLYVHVADVHDPYDTTPHYNRLWDPGYKGTIDGSRETLGEINDGRRPLSGRDLRHLLALYDGGISYTDAQIARIIAELKTHGVYDRTMIIVTSDHGESFREHGNIMQHGGSAYETELRIPLIIKIPGGKPGVRIANVTSGIDIAPTVLDALGVASPPSFQGRSALALLAGKPFPDEVPAFSLTAALPKPRAARAVRDGRWKLIRAEATGQVELYDLAADPGERKNLARARPEVASRLNGLLESREKSAAAAAAALPPPSASALIGRELEALLRAAGYVK